RHSAIYLSNSPHRRHPPERRLLILGGPRSGKTTTANTILGEEAFDGGVETTHSNVGQTEIYGRRVTVVDTPARTPKRIRQESQRGAALLRPGPHTLLLVLGWTGLVFGLRVGPAARGPCGRVRL
uniref:AIG1-type G domain-containing protein n=1 Tax=Periophthalmus magnuspinnatus TaxID=409849 RepID=A0A3B4ACV4_9GOBI